MVEPTVDRRLRLGLGVWRQIHLQALLRLRAILGVVWRFSVACAKVVLVLLEESRGELRACERLGRHKISPRIQRDDGRARRAPRRVAGFQGQGCVWPRPLRFCEEHDEGVGDNIVPFGRRRARGRR